MMSDEPEVDGSPHMPVETYEETAPESPAHKDPFGWLATQNKELKDKIKKLEIELYHWTLSAHESKERLNRIYQNRGKQNYIDVFYDSMVKRLIHALSEENVVLKNELCIKDGVNTVTKISELRNIIRTLSDQLEIRSEENKLLKNEIKNLKCPDVITERKNKFSELEKAYLKTTVENANLKNHLKSKTEIMSYLKSAFDKQRKEFIKIFTEHYLQNGDEFIKQLQLLDPPVPDFLNKRDVSTSTDPLLIPDQTRDSGIDTPDEFVELMSKSRELEEAKETIKQLEERLTTTINQKAEFIVSLERRTKILEEDVRKKQEQLDDANNDAAWQVAYSQLYSKLEQLQRRNNQVEAELTRSRLPPVRQQHSSPDLKRYGGQFTQEKIPEPYQSVNWSSGFNTTSTLVRDSAIKASDSHGPKETQDVSRYSPRGQLSRPPAADNMTACSKQENKESVEQKPLIQCKICKRDIHFEKYNSHIVYCGKSGSHMC